MADKESRNQRQAGNHNRRLPGRVLSLILIQLVVIAALAASLYNEYAHNLYFQTYISNLMSSNFRSILLGIILMVITLVIIDGLWPAVARNEAEKP